MRGKKIHNIMRKMVHKRYKAKGGLILWALTNEHRILI